MRKDKELADDIQETTKSENPPEIVEVESSLYLRVLEKYISRCAEMLCP